VFVPDEPFVGDLSVSLADEDGDGNELSRTATVTLHVDGSTFSAFNGTDQKRVITSITADEMRTHNPATSLGGASADTVYRRAK